MLAQRGFTFHISNFFSNVTHKNRMSPIESLRSRIQRGALLRVNLVIGHLCAGPCQPYAALTSIKAKLLC
jgi:hypothetical protein